MKKIFSLIVFSILLYACSSDNSTTCTTKIVLTDNLETVYNCENTTQLLDIPTLHDNYIIIRDIDTFLEKVTGACVTEIDFDKYDLLIGKKGLTNGLSSISYKMTIDCNVKDPVVDVTFYLNETTEAPNVTYHVFVPKLGEERNLTVNLYMKN